MVINLIRLWGLSGNFHHHQVLPCIPQQLIRKGVLANMLEKFMEKMLENAAAAYAPMLGGMAEKRAYELREMRTKIRTSPEEVEAWFDKEIEKVCNIKVEDIIRKVDEKPDYLEQNGLEPKSSKLI
jgi:hypothetical protein